MPVQEYLDNLNPKQARKVAWVIGTIEDLSGQGERIPVEYFTKLPDTDDIWEVRATFGGNIFRILCFHDDGDIVLAAHGFTKKTQKAPAKEIRTAEARKKEYEQDN